MCARCLSYRLATMPLRIDQESAVSEAKEAEDQEEGEEGERDGSREVSHKP
jgi:hypothetical protein